MLYAYVDETGDRGISSKRSSPVFGMAAVLVSRDSAAVLRDAVLQLRGEYGIPDGVVMSCKNHLKNHSKLLHAAQTLAVVPAVKIIYVYCQKSEVTGGYVNDPARFYNYVALKMYRNILWAAKHDCECAGLEGVHTRFGHVRGHDHRTTREYLIRQAADEPRIPSELERGLRWVAPDNYLESQAADLYGGFLKAAIWPDQFGNVEGRHIQEVWHQIRRGSWNCAVPLGLMSMPSSELVKNMEWYHCDCPECS